MNAIETRQLTKVYREIGKPTVHSLRGVDLTVREGEVFGFLGRNGAGKTTTIKVLCSLIKPTSGEALLLGKPARTREARRSFGYLPEQPYFYEYLTPRETIHFYGKLHGLARAEREREWDRLSELLDLRGIASQRIKGFSKGMRQRIGFAVALVGDPPILILDEPMSGLDPLGRRMIRQLILQQRDQRKTLFFSSHVLGDVEQICDRVGILVGGRMLRAGRIDELTGGQSHQVEVVMRCPDAALLGKLREQGEKYRGLDDLEIVTYQDEARANQAVHSLLDGGGELVEYNPLRQSLEAYFLEGHAQEPAQASAEAAP